MRGLYIHIPFCVKKCDYCDFYSVAMEEKLLNKYVSRVCEEIQRLHETFDTLYFGGGTPSLLAHRITDIVPQVLLVENAEVTLECNPSSDLTETLILAAKVGVNRISIGLQTSIDSELAFLTRRHNKDAVAATVAAAKAAGIHNISLDIMLGLEGQTVESLKKTLDFCLLQNVTHISAYILKLEEGTAFYKNKERFSMPDEDLVCELYEFCCAYLEANEFYQYEISNFAKKGYLCRHNLKYWNCDEYLGIGPAAHSFYEGKRFYYPRELDYFINGCPTIFDAIGGTVEEYIMLRLRLSEGLIFADCETRNYHLPENLFKRAEALLSAGLIILDEKHLALTRKGFLVQNKVLIYLFEN